MPRRMNHQSSYGFAPAADLPRRRRPGGSVILPTLMMAMLVAPLARRASAQPKDPLATYAELFGAEEKRVAATSSTKDDAKFAASLLEKAKSLGDDPTLLGIVCERAYDFGMKDPDGYPAAAAALKQMSAGTSMAKEEIQAKYQNLLKLQLKRGSPEQRIAAAEELINDALEAGEKLAKDNKYTESLKAYKEAATVATSVRSPWGAIIDAQIRDAQARQSAYDRVQKLQAKVSAGDAVAVIQAVDIYVAELDDPESAVKLVAQHPDVETRQMVELAVRDPSAVAPADLLKLAAWYKKLAARQRGNAEAVTLARAAGLYAAFLEKHPKQDAERLQASEQMTDVVKRLSAATGGPSELLVLCNANNLVHNDRGTTGVNVIGYLHGEAAWRRNNVRIDWVRGSDVPTSVLVPRLGFDKLRIEIVGWQGLGAGLSEIQYFRGGKNIALGRPVTASGAYDPNFPASSVTDGTLNSGVYQKGYWLLPDKTPGWVEIALTTPKDKK